MENLTEAQARYLSAIEQAGFKRYNGRALKVIKNLASKGLVRYSLKPQPHALGRLPSWSILAVPMESDLDPEAVHRRECPWLFGIY